jgi:hypothetical protein
MRWGWATVAVCLLGGARAGAELAAEGPAAELRAAVVDLETRVARERWSETRYLSLYAVPEARREAVARVASFVLNSVSRAESLARPEVVPGSEGGLLRIWLARYGLPAEAWESLVADDATWHLRTRVLDPRTGTEQEVVTDGGWVGLAEAAKLRAATGSAGALLRADDFVARGSTTIDGGRYYELAGVPAQEGDFLRALGVDAAEIGALGADAGANVIASRVTFKLRRVVRRQGPLGGAWHTYDVENSGPERDPFRRPFDFQYDAGEHIAALRNGLHVFALYDAQGKRQASVPDRIAKDATDRSGGGIVQPLLSCVRCHVEDGLRAFPNDMQRLWAEQITLVAPRREDAERIASFYGRDLKKPLTRDREDYAAAVAEATGGWRSEVLAAELDQTWFDFARALVTSEQAAREVGLETEGEGAVAAGDAGARMGDAWRGTRDPVLLALAAGVSVQRAQWHASFAEAATRALGETKR